MKFEFRFWAANSARRRYGELVANGVRCNIASDGKGVICFL